MNDIRSLVEAAFISAISVILIIVMKQIPILNYIVFVIPSVFALIWVRRGRKYGILAVIDASIILLIFGFVIEAIFILLYCGMISAVMSELIIRKKTTSVVIFAGAFGAFLAMFALLYSMDIFTGVKFTTILNQSMQEARSIIPTISSDELMMKSMNEQIEMMEFVVKQFLPSILFFCAFTASLFNYITIRWSFKRFLNITIRRDYLRNFTLPNNLMYGILFLMVSGYLLKRFGMDPSGAVSDNVLSLSFFALYIQGLAVLSFYAHIKKWSRGVKIAIVVACILFMSLLQLFFILLGCSDLVFNIRKRMKKQS